MFIIVLERPQSVHLKSTPLLLPITPELLKKPCSHLQKLCLEHFKINLSPFISANNLELSTPSEIMKSDCPIFFYADIYPEKPTKQQLDSPQLYLSQKQYVQSIFCRPIAFSEQNQKYRLLKLINSVMIKKIPRQQSKQTKRIPQRIINRQKLEEIDKYIPSNMPIYITGRQIHLLEENLQNKLGGEISEGNVNKWSIFIGQKWDKFVSENGCIYILF